MKVKSTPIPLEVERKQGKEMRQRSVVATLSFTLVDDLQAKRDSANAFDVTMGSYEGAEICELVSLFILSKLKDTFGNNIGLYRDDGLVLLDRKSSRLSDKARKDLTHAFNKLGLNITAQANQLSTNFLDITFDLSNGT